MVETEENLGVFFFELILSIVMAIIGVEFMKLAINQFSGAEALILGAGSVLLLMVPIMFIAFKLGLFKKN